MYIIPFYLSSGDTVQIDIVFPNFNRLAFAQHALRLLVRNTNWSLVRRLKLYDDGSTDGTADLLACFAKWANHVLIPTDFIPGPFEGPVSIMNAHLRSLDAGGADPDVVMAKIDNDTCVPPGWLDACVELMKAEPAIDLLGIEAFSPPVPYAPGQKRYMQPSSHIGGIGLMRVRCFGPPRRPLQPRGIAGRFGFTEWQHDNPDVIRGWLTPALPVVLLDHVPRVIWREMAELYVRKGWSRAWGCYGEDTRASWEWALQLDEGELLFFHEWGLPITHSDEITIPWDSSPITEL